MNRLKDCAAALVWMFLVWVMLQAALAQAGEAWTRLESRYDGAAGAAFTSLVWRKVDSTGARSGRFYSIQTTCGEAWTRTLDGRLVVDCLPMIGERYRLCDSALHLQPWILATVAGIYEFDCLDELARDSFEK